MTRITFTRTLTACRCPECAKPFRRKVFPEEFEASNKDGRLWVECRKCEQAALAEWAKGEKAPEINRKCLVPVSVSGVVYGRRTEADRWIVP